MRCEVPLLKPKGEQLLSTLRMEWASRSFQSLLITGSLNISAIFRFDRIFIRESVSSVCLGKCRPNSMWTREFQVLEIRFLCLCQGTSSKREIREYDHTKWNIFVAKSSSIWICLPRAKRPKGKRRWTMCGLPAEIDFPCKLPQKLLSHMRKLPAS